MFYKTRFVRLSAVLQIYATRRVCKTKTWQSNNRVSALPTASLITGSSRYVRPALRVRASWTHLLRMTSSLAFANDARIRAPPFTRFLFFCIAKNKKIPSTERMVRVFTNQSTTNDSIYLSYIWHPDQKLFWLVWGFNHIYLHKNTSRKKSTDVIFIQSVQNFTSYQNVRKKTTSINRIGI